MNLTKGLSFFKLRRSDTSNSDAALALEASNRHLVDDPETKDNFGSYSSKEEHMEVNRIKAPRAVYKGHSLPVQCVGALSYQNETLIFSGGEDKIILIWSLRTGKKLAELTGHEQRITGICGFAAPARAPFLASCSWDERVIVWPLGVCFDQLRSMDDITNNESEAAAILRLSKAISEGRKSVHRHKNRIFDVSIVQRPNHVPFLVSGSADNTIIVWSSLYESNGSLSESPKELYKLENKKDETWVLCVSSWNVKQKAEILCGCKNGSIRRWPLVSSKVKDLAPVEIKGCPSAVHSISPFDANDESFVAAACKSKDILIYSLHSGTHKHALLVFTLYSVVHFFSPCPLYFHTSVQIYLLLYCVTLYCLSN
jgi:WD40 repeat protein